MYAKSNMETYITMCKIDSQWAFAVWLRDLKQGLCINLEGWNGEGDGREVQKGRDIRIPMADMDFHDGSDGKASAYNAGDPGSIPASGRSPGEGTHSSILAWKIPWTEEPGRLQSMGSQRVGHDWVSSLSLSWLTHVEV